MKRGVWKHFSRFEGIFDASPYDDNPRAWKVFVDGASSALGAEAGIVVIITEGIKLEHSFKLGFKASNNEAEYKVLLAGLRVVSNLSAKEVEVYSNSRLVVN